jgi:drug/metabolite transporter (DMT)-like permease
MKEERNAKLLLLMVVVFWGLNVVMVKFLSGHFTPLMLASYRIGSAALLLGVVVWKQHGFPKVTRGEFLSISGIAVSGIFLHQWMLGAGVQTTSASTASLILGLNPLVTAFLAYLLFREPLTGRKIFGAMLGLGGVALVIFGNSWEQTSSLHFGKGEWLVFLAMLFYVISGMFIKKATQTQPVMVVTAYSHIIATVILFIFSYGQEMITGTSRALPSDWWVWTVLIFSGWVSTALGSLWWNRGIQVIGAGRTAMFLNGMPIASLVFAVLFLDERITWLQGAGFLTVLFAIWLGTSHSKARQELPPTVTPSQS